MNANMGIKEPYTEKQLVKLWNNHEHRNIERGVQPEDGEGSEKGRLRSEIKQEFTC